MGNKHDVAPVVAELVRRRRRDRPFLDVFCGLCSVGGAVARTGHSVVGNDVQSFAALVARCLVATPESPPSREELNDSLRRSYLYNERRLLERFGADVASEARILANADAPAYRRAYARWRHAANNKTVAAELAAIRQGGDRRPYRLATLSFAWGYFGLRQAITIDSIRFAIDRAREAGRLTPAGADWALVALLQAASCASASPGHFAQYLGPASAEGFVRILRQRRRDIWEQFLHEAGELEPYGSTDWRRGNDVMQSDALDVWEELDKFGDQDWIVYADPPYSKDHYSRYYHVLETLTRYDHPAAVGKGRYRPDRFATPFSLKTRVESAMGDLCGAIAERGYTFILSYPSNGLLNAGCGVDPGDLLREHFGRVDLRMRRLTSHSTLGARHGSARNSVHELLWMAR
ncbi:MAG TPA: DNA adenine methylase [Solirubrobacteraceae bacterium]|jgi:adenine-specific DNA-methyltransferase|nr:DNA adenine methylase [Solirubrobacteraceae bacterium]